MRPGRPGTLAPWLRAIAFLLLLGVRPATAQTTLFWIMPTGSSPASEFRIYKGATPLAGELVLSTLPSPDAGGVYSAQVQIDEIDQGTPVYVWLTAANASGASPASNTKFYPEGCDPLVDPDCDGVPSDGAPGSVPCATGQSAGCDDNCPWAANPGQQDAGGIGSSSLPDGIGNECQCGDVSGNGRVNSVDSTMITRALLTPPTMTMVRPDLCNVWLPGCNSVDATIVLRATLVPPTATIQQQCEPAQPPAP